MARTISPAIVTVLADVFSMFTVKRKENSQEVFTLDAALSALQVTGRTVLFCYNAGAPALLLNVFPDVIGAGGARLYDFANIAASRLTCINRLPLQGFPHRTYKPYTPIYTSLVGRLAVYDIDASTDEPPLAFCSSHETDVDTVLASFLKSHGECLAMHHKTLPDSFGEPQQVTIIYAAYEGATGAFVSTWCVEDKGFYAAATYKLP